MNTFYILVPILLASIGLIECDSNATDLSGTRYATYCYYCADCPNPFYSSSPAVTPVFSTTGWCMKRSLSSSKYAPASRGVALPGYCVYNGCTWRGNEYVCCCDRRSYCNTANGKSYSILAVLGLALMALFQR